jgi:hypothetical protein
MTLGENSLTAPEQSLSLTKGACRRVIIQGRLRIAL